MVMAVARFIASCVFAVAITLLLSPKVQAAAVDYDPPSGTRGWCTPVGPGQSACFGSPAAACQAQWEVYGEPFIPNAGPLRGFKDTSNWSAKECDWDYNASPAPTIVLFQCNFPSSAVAPGRCVNGWNNFKQCADPCANFGSHPAPATPGPIDLFSGSKILEATDFENETSTLAVRRRFGSLSYSGSPAGMLRPQTSAGNWRFGFSVELQLTNAISSGIVSVLLPDGSLLAFIKQTDGSLAPYVTSAYPVPRTDYRLALSGAWPATLSDLKLSSSTWTLTGPDAVWTLTTKLDPVLGQYVIGTPDTMGERQGPNWSFAYGTAGALETLTDQFGNQLTFDWIMSTAGAAHPMAVSEIGLPGGRRLRYGYEDSEGGEVAPERLVTVEWLSPTNVVEDRARYIYGDDRYPLLITEVQDADDVGRWFVAYQEDGKAASSAAALGARRHTVTYASATGSHTRVVTGPLGRQTTYTWSAGGYPFNSNLQSIAQAASPNAPASTETFSSSGFQMTSTTDAEGRVTTYARDAVGRPVLISEADGTPLERQTAITWHSTFNAPARIAGPGLTVDFTYDAAGRVTSRTLTDTTMITVPYATNGRTRTWTYDWSAAGLLEDIDGPLPGTGDTMTFGYDAQGYLTSITNEVGHVTTVTARDWRGAPLTIEDENGIDTLFTYDIRGRPTSVTINSGPDQSVYAMTYDAVGNLSRLTLPEGGWLDYAYDAASRLTGVENDRGETQTFAVNALGQPVSQTIRDASPSITFQQTQAYDELGRIRQMVGAGTQTWSLGYDKVDNLVAMTDPRSRVWGDDLGRPEPHSDGHGPAGRDRRVRLFAQRRHDPLRGRTRPGDDPDRGRVRPHHLRGQPRPR
jgi:YD repeat-containing protein